VGVTEATLSADYAVAHVVLLECEERSTHGGKSVEVLRWPEEGDRLEELRAAGTPRLLVVGPDDDPVMPSDDLEDWVRMPVDDRDIRTRLQRLRHRVDSVGRPPSLDDYGRLTFRERWVVLSTMEERLARPLVESFGRVVHYENLLRCGWPDEDKSRSVLRPRISGLRRRIEPLGLRLRSVRDLGHVLEEGPRSG
jgi:two-component system OmpR family response regulator